MKAVKKYRVHDVTHKGGKTGFMVQKKGRFLGIWYDISYEMSRKEYADNLCKELNEHNND